jgi:hypothetical protein
MAAIDFHPCLHGGLPKRGTGTATIEAKLAQQLAWMEQEPVYQVFVDLRKAYDHLDRERCRAIMTGYGVGPKLLRLQAKFWEQAEMVCRAGGSFGKPFHAFPYLYGPRLWPKFLLWFAQKFGLIVSFIVLSPTYVCTKPIPKVQNGGK